jgi:serine/threonine-protein kinase RsbW
VEDRESNFEIRVPTRTDCLEIVRDFVSKVAGKAGITREVVDDIELAVDEACSNVMLHAHRLDSKKEVRVEVRIADEKLTIQLLDEGPQFDPTQVSSPDMKEYLEQHRVGGLGIYLIRRLMDEVEYRRDSAGRNCLRMVKYFDLPSGDSRP